MGWQTTPNARPSRNPAVRPPVKPPAAEWARCSPADLPTLPAPGEVYLCLVSLDEPPWPRSVLQAVLDEGERERAARFRFDVHRHRFENGRGLMRHLLGHALGTAPADLRFVAGAQGKPRLAASAGADPPRPAIDFNLSHSGASMLLGLSDGAELGVDIEVPREVRELQDIAERNFAPAEWRQLIALPVEQQQDAFLACWTRKEAFVKALGGGLSVPLDGFEVSLRPGAPPALLRTSDPAHPVGDFTLWAGRTPQGDWCAAIVRRPCAIVRTFSLL